MSGRWHQVGGYNSADDGDKKAQNCDNCAFNFARRANHQKPVQPPSQKYSDFQKTQISSIFSPSCPTEGRLEIVTDAGQDAVDASSTKDEGAFLRTVKSCGPDAPTLASSSREAIFAGDGGKKARSPGRARRNPLKPLRGECRAISGVT
jgi:hypothetical protein